MYPVRDIILHFEQCRAPLGFMEAQLKAHPETPQTCRKVWHRGAQGRLAHFQGMRDGKSFQLDLLNLDVFEMWCTVIRPVPPLRGQKRQSPTHKTLKLSALAKFHILASQLRAPLNSSVLYCPGCSGGLQKSSKLGPPWCWEAPAPRALIRLIVVWKFHYKLFLINATAATPPIQISPPKYDTFKLVLAMPVNWHISPDVLARIARKILA